MTKWRYFRCSVCGRYFKVRTRGKPRAMKTIAEHFKAAKAVADSLNIWTANTLCKLFGHRWKFMGRSGMDDYTPGYIVYQCQRCKLYCHEHEDTGERVIW